MDIEEMSEAIVAKNDKFRQIIDPKDINKLTHRSIGAIQGLNNNHDKFRGTGVLISKDLVLTVAHNLYDRTLKYRFTHLKYFLGATGVGIDNV